MGASLCYLPDHEPALLGPIEDLESQWISGYALAHDATLLIHDCQYTDAEYPAHYGWGHSAISQAVGFADRCNATRTLLFHHDPGHTDDQLDAARDKALGRWQQLGHSADGLAMASEGDELTMTPAAGRADALAAPTGSSG